MFPNLRLLIAAFFAGLIVLSGGAAVFAVFRVNHEPLTRLTPETATAALALHQPRPAQISVALDAPFAAQPVADAAPLNQVLSFAPATPAPVEIESPSGSPNLVSADGGTAPASQDDPTVAAPQAAAAAAPSPNMETASVAPEIHGPTEPPASPSTDEAASGPSGPSIPDDAEAGETAAAAAAPPPDAPEPPSPPAQSAVEPPRDAAAQVAAIGHETVPAAAGPTADAAEIGKPDAAPHRMKRKHDSAHKPGRAAKAAESAKRRPVRRRHAVIAKRATPLDTPDHPVFQSAPQNFMPPAPRSRRRASPMPRQASGADYPGSAQ